MSVLIGTVAPLTAAPTRRYFVLPPVLRDASVYDQPTVFLDVDDLHPLIHPAHVVRENGMTLLTVDPTALRVEFVFWGQENLTDAERIALREAFGAPTDLRRPVPDELLDGPVWRPWEVPKPLQLPDQRTLRSA